MATRTRLLLVATLVAAAMLPVAGTAVADGDHNPPGQGQPDPVLAWNETATSAAIACGLSGAPPIESRMYAMMHIAIHDAVNAIRVESAPYAYRPHRLSPNASPTAAVAAAGWNVLKVGLAGCPALGTAESVYTAMLASVTDSAARAAGQALGEASAAAIQVKREKDHAALQISSPTDSKFPQGTKPGEWRFTPNADGSDVVGFAFLPKWGSVTPFTLRSSDQFAPSDPYRLGSRQYADDVNEIKSLGAKTGSTRNAEQTEIAVFWVGSSPYQWNAIARTVAGQSRQMDLWDNARLFGLLNMAMADGYISSFEVKYDELFWRPVTAIRLADTDGNDRTQEDKKWLPLVETPPIPDYDSAHAVEGAAAAAVLRSVFGDRTSFSNCSPWLPAGNSCAGGTGGQGVVRTFTSFSQAAAENGVSRIYVGFHFRKAVDDGLRHGQKIGNRAVTTAMQPAHR